MTRFTDGPAKGKRLSLARHPLYLRVVIDAAGNVDALDQLDDEPKEGETLYAYRRTSVSNMHVSYSEGGRRKGRWEQLADYEVCPDQPDQATLRDAARWRQWCGGRAEEGKP